MTAAPTPATLDQDAAAFLTQFHAERRRPGLDARLEAVRAQGFTPTAEELAFAARVAWRNSTRCVGRLPWAALDVHDLRGVTDPAEVAAHLIEHLHGAFAGGAIRPRISVFAPGVRVLNPQLIRYAAYPNADGTVTGDPVNLRLTAFLRSLGWAGGAGTPFDVLPIAIQSGRRTELFELPADAVHEVPITHPDYPGIGALGVKWHALPVISDMDLNVGGVRLACAFNGWYVQTEIAARNLADADRYDLLPRVAAALGLDTRRERTLWRDRALVELNVAVLESFAAAGVKVVDHHTVTRQFTRFEAREARAGRGVRGRWSWLIPPVSPATTPVWHRAYDDREDTPNFERVPAPWDAPVRVGCPFH
ncbi:nitric-oxide synthase [Deinococcus metalli]|uniref:Nitric oxide synthase oxygenase n=1 Tax=Deinococcus metalli TaxID=1141878 RepID=A0A7W8KE83_9DEIO|nr:nitric oxide synthase oxygenase [Deinococcus metalli]MBB5376320.1 nitric-oxide synthase [Deinococcus metalli]GHF39173.1 nitric oxide synthase oxygenase [Deinococcus metalli]